MAEAEKAQLGITVGGKPDSLAGAKECKWTVSGQFGVLLTLDPKKGVKDLNYAGATPKPVSIGQHAATKVSGGLHGEGKDTGACDVFVAVTESSSASIFVTNAGSKDTVLACQRAEQVAKFIDPKLP